MSPKFVWPSSNAHQRVFGIPENVAGVGTMARLLVDGFCGSGGGLPRTVPGAMSVEYQSMWPWKYWSATRTFSTPGPPGAEQANRYSRRAGIHAHSPDGGAMSVSNQAMNRVARSE